MTVKELVGKTIPRFYTPEKVDLTPATSKGFAVIEFAEHLGYELLEWQKWFLIHALELKADGTYRFKTILLLVSRQNGKSMIVRILALWLLATRDNSMVLGTSTSMELAREPFYAVADDAEAQGWVKRVTRGSLDSSVWLHNGSRYKVASANRRGGRSLSVDLLMVDELREQVDDFDAWNALTGTTTARPESLTIAMSNAGDDRSLVLNSLRASALAGDDDALAIFEWSAPDDCELDDEEATAQANPALGQLITMDTLKAKRNTMPPNGYRTEHLCQRVEAIDPAIDKAAWMAGADPTAMSPELRKRVVVGFDVSPDLSHCTLVAGAALSDGRVRIETVAAWDNTTIAMKELPDLLQRIRPIARVWFPAGPAAALAPDLTRLKFTDAGKPAEVCQSLSEFVASGRLVHSDDPMLNAQVITTSKTNSGDGWRFTRRGAGNCDGVYATAAVVSLIRHRLTTTRKSRIIMPTSA